MMDELTQREKEVASCAASGLSNQEIASEIGIKETAVRQYMHRVYEKLGVDGRAGGRAELPGRVSPK